MENIQFEKLSKRGQFVVEKYKQFIERNLNKTNNNVLYGYEDLGAIESQKWYPHSLYLGNINKVKEAYDNKSPRDSFGIFIHHNELLQINKSDIISNFCFMKSKQISNLLRKIYMNLFSLLLSNTS